MRVRYRDGLDRPAMMEPGEVCEVRFVLYPTRNRFAAGHRMRVLVSVVVVPALRREPKHGRADRPAHAHTPRANTIHHSPEHPSHVTLPVVPSE